MTMTHSRSTAKQLIYSSMALWALMTSSRYGKAIRISTQQNPQPTG